MADSSAKRSILITGGSSGIGEALALLYAAPGVHLALTGRDPGRLEAVAEACRARGASVSARPVAATDREGMAAFVNGAAQAGKLDLVIANAGVGATFKDWSKFDEVMRSVTSVNIDGVLNTVNPAVPIMVAQGSGQIAIVSSIAGLVVTPGAVPYSATKHFARAYAEELRGRLAPQGVKVSAICPGFVTTRLTAKNRFPMPFLMDADRAARIIRAGLERDKGRIVFPWPMHLLATVINLLPFALRDALMRRTPRKE